MVGTYDEGFLLPHDQELKRKRKRARVLTPTTACCCHGLGTRPLTYGLFHFQIISLPIPYWTLLPAMCFIYVISIHCCSLLSLLLEAQYVGFCTSTKQMESEEVKTRLENCLWYTAGTSAEISFLPLTSLHQSSWLCQCQFKFSKPKLPNHWAWRIFALPKDSLIQHRWAIRTISCLPASMSWTSTEMELAKHLHKF